MRNTWTDRLLDHVNKPGYKPQTPKALAKRMQVPHAQKNAFRDAIKQLVREGAVSFGKNHEVRSSQKPDLIQGTIRITSGGFGFVRPTSDTVSEDIYIPGFAVADAMSGDTVMVEMAKGKSRLGPRGIVSGVVERGTKQFVGTYSERGGQGYVIVDAGTINEPVHVGDPGVKGAKPGDKVVLELIRFPTIDRAGEGVITEVLGPANSATVETLSVIRAFNIPEHFSSEALEEARVQASRFNENDLHGRRDFTKELIITIDPADAKDFDDAVRIRFDPGRKHWYVDVHIADVAHFVPYGGHLDKDARERGTSVYLPQKVIPMLPEVISNHLASLQEGQLRYVQSVLMEFDSSGEPIHSQFVRGAIRVSKRFSYEQVSEFYQQHDAGETSEIDSNIQEMLLLLRKFTLMRRKRRHKQGSLELDMPEVELDYTSDGKVDGAHLASHDISHQVIEECMLSANESVATKLDDLGVAFLRRIHPAPEPVKLEEYLSFVQSLGYEVNRKTPTDRFQLQRLLTASANRPDKHAVHYGMLRSMKQAIYSPNDEAHYALASDNYCHFTSPIRRYPDLTVHRLIARWQNTGKVSSDMRELIALGEHCSNTERRAAKAEQELIKIRLLDYLSDKLGSVWKAVITGVENFGFFCTPMQLPVDGLVRIAALSDDYYQYDEATHSLIGGRKKKRFRLGDTVWVEVARVDVYRRRLDFRVVDDPSGAQPVSTRQEADDHDRPAKERVVKKRRSMKPNKPKSKKKRK